MIERTCLTRESDLHLSLLYYLLANPVGTPLPGGFEVEIRDGEYICPIGDKADDIENTLCPYCPAGQSDT
jgi:uncharacterized protein (UPF0305 family)